jgi:hypothetical protein
MTRDQRRAALVQLGNEFIAIAMTAPKAWETTKSKLGDPVMLDRFALSCHTAADALMQLAARSQEYAGDLLDDGDD